MIEENLETPKLIRLIAIIIFFAMIPLIVSSAIQLLYLSPNTEMVMTNIFGELQPMVTKLDKIGLPAQWLVDIAPLPVLNPIASNENIKAISILTSFLFSGLFWASAQFKINRVNEFIRQAEINLNREINRMR